MELLPVLTTYLLVFVYSTLFLGHIKSLATGLVGMRLTLSLCGVLLVVLAVSSSLGLLSYLGLPANLLVLRVMPLLVLAVGLDNLFFLVHSYEMVGISQRFSSHFVWQFLFCSLPTRHLRAVSVLTETGGLVVGGIAMTKLLAVLPSSSPSLASTILGCTCTRASFSGQPCMGWSSCRCSSATSEYTPVNIIFNRKLRSDQKLTQRRLQEMAT